MKAKVCSVMRPARLDEEYIVRPVPESEPDDDEAVSGVARGSVRSPLKKGKSGGKKLFCVKNLKTLKSGSLSGSVNSEPTVA